MFTACPGLDQDDAHAYRCLDRPLRAIARRCIKSWFNRERLDQLLSEKVRALEDCELIYAIDVNGRQVSSNVHREFIDPSAYGQDLSARPYVVSLAVLNDRAALRDAFVCDAYVSRLTRHACVTAMCRVRSGETLLGYIAADFREMG